VYVEANVQIFDKGGFIGSGQSSSGSVVFDASEDPEINQAVQWVLETK